MLLLRLTLLVFVVLVAALAVWRPMVGVAASPASARAQKFIDAHVAKLRPLEIKAGLAWWDANVSGKDEDFKRKEDGYAWVNLGEGDVDWSAVRQAFADIGYSGSVITELDGGNESYLRDVSQRIDRLLLGRG